MITQDAFHENTLVHNLQFNRQQFSFVSYGPIDRQILERISIPFDFQNELSFVWQSKNIDLINFHVNKGFLLREEHFLV